MLVVKIILTGTFLMVFLQDIKERQVYWFLFPIIAICSGILLYKNMLSDLFFLTLSINLIFVLVLFTIVFIYSKFKLKASIHETFGLGDALFFLAVTCTFSSVSFLILFVFGLLFSLVMHLVLKRNSKYNTVPLAGYLSLFFAIAYLAHWFGFLKTVYTI